MRQCNKIPYSSKAKARKHLREKCGRTPCKRAYQCPVCSMPGVPVYHLTSQSNTENRKVKSILGK